MSRPWHGRHDDLAWRQAWHQARAKERAAAEAVRLGDQRLRLALQASTLRPNSPERAAVEADLRRVEAALTKAQPE